MPAGTFSFVVPNAISLPLVYPVIVTPWSGPVSVWMSPLSLYAVVVR